MKLLSQQQLQSQVDTFNLAYPVGTKVEVFKNSKRPETFIDEVSSPASILSGHTAMTWLKEKGSYDLTFIKGPIKEEDL